jgi:small-conductance mechanosensitive channel
LRIIYVFSVIAASFALLGVRSIVPDWSAVALIILVACVVAFRGTLREILTGLYFNTKNFKGRTVRIGDTVATIESNDLFHTWLKEDGKEHVRPNSEVFAALRTLEYQEPVEMRTDTNAQG